MGLLDQLQAASGYSKPDRRVKSSWEDVKKAVRDTLTRIPMSRKQVILQSKVSPDKVDRALKELVATKVVDIVRPGEFGRRSLYVLARQKG